MECESYLAVTVGVQIRGPAQISPLMKNIITGHLEKIINSAKRIVRIWFHCVLRVRTGLVYSSVQHISIRMYIGTGFIH